MIVFRSSRCGESDEHAPGLAEMQLELATLTSCSFMMRLALTIRSVLLEVNPAATFIR